jgi:hypothetical protein
VVVLAVVTVLQTDSLVGLVAVVPRKENHLLAMEPLATAQQDKGQQDYPLSI